MMWNNTELLPDLKSKISNAMIDKNDDMHGISNPSQSTTPMHMEESKHNTSPTKSINFSSDLSFLSGRKLNDKEQRECAVIGNL